MATKRSVWFALGWTTTLLVIPSLIWAGGFLVWRFKIAMALANVKREAKERLKPDSHLPSLLCAAGSRAIPDLFREMEASISQSDVTTALVNYRELVYTWSFARTRYCCDNNNLWIYTGMTENTPIEYLERIHLMEKAQWDKERHRYPPWWMWWDGFRR